MMLSSGRCEPSAEMIALLRADGLPTDDLLEDGRFFLRFSDETGAFVGFGGFEVLGTRVLLRSIVVPPGLRGRGFGAEIVGRLIDASRDAGANEAYALTRGPRTFLATLGFRPLERAKAPSSILGTRQATGLCAASAILWHKEIGA